MSKDFDQLKLENQLCFPLYAASRLVIREYQPYLDELKITYPQYLVLMVLWESNGIAVNDIAQKLILNTNTVTPLLKRMEKMGLLERKRQKEDERKVIISLTPAGQEMRLAAAEIPLKLGERLSCGSIQLEELKRLKQDLHLLINQLTEE
ncbi:transcriptional regulator, SarA/Rot family [Persicobacter diffluens]|uniref:Organic hydroperoxide resistance transcriptional regulator n=1 Tax=Persicobacter diffluens TaxID=981 RepID=A0AAN4W0Y0_9BACT|nr:organic hydroperoxide resistance transcriptional regulator [Persicobacter diffluens]